MGGRMELIIPLYKIVKIYKEIIGLLNYNFIKLNCLCQIKFY